MPNKTNELVSGGYDCTLIHFDYRLGTLLSSFEIREYNPLLSFYSLSHRTSFCVPLAATPGLAPGISSVPPFITAMSISSLGVVAAGTADGRIWVGGGGSKSSTTSDKGRSNKKARKWNGLDEKEGSMTKVAENLIGDL